MSDAGELAKRVDELEEALGALSDAVINQPGAGEPARGSRPENRPQIWRWHELDAAEAEAAWAELTAWVDDVLVARHPRATEELRTSGGCWYRHPDIVELLSAMYFAWQAAFGPGAGPTAAIDWLDRWLPSTMKRVSELLRAEGCANGSHGNRSPLVGYLQVTNRSDWQAFVADDVAGRP